MAEADEGITMEDISRAWWIGYVCTFVAGVMAIAVVAWYLLPRPEAPVPPPPPPPVATVEAPPPPPQFAYPRMPNDPAIRDLFRAMARALRTISSCRVETTTVSTYVDGSGSSGEHALGKNSNVWLVKGNSYRQSTHVTESTRHPSQENSKNFRTAPYDYWEVRNNMQEAKYFSGDTLVRAFSLDVIDAESGEASWPSAWILRNGFTSHIGTGEPDQRVELVWSLRTVPSEKGDLMLIAGDPVPGGPHQHIRCELVLDPARDGLVVRESYWMNGELREEETNELQQLPDGRWFPKRCTHQFRDQKSITEYIDVQMNVEVDDSQFEIESLPCDWETVLVSKEVDGPFGGKYLKYVDRRWKEVPPPKKGIVSSRGKVELARPKE